MPWLRWSDAFRSWGRPRGPRPPQIISAPSKANAIAFHKLTKLRERLDTLYLDAQECPKYFLKPSGMSIHHGPEPGSEKAGLSFEGESVPLDTLLRRGSQPEKLFPKCATSLTKNGLTFPALMDIMRDALSALFCLHMSGYVHGKIDVESLFVRCAPEGSHQRLHALLVNYESLAMLNPKLAAKDVSDMIHIFARLLEPWMKAEAAHRKAKRILLFFLWKKYHKLEEAYARSPEENRLKSVLDVLDLWSGEIDPPDRQSMENFKRLLLHLPHTEIDLTHLRGTGVSKVDRERGVSEVDLRHFRDDGVAEVDLSHLRDAGVSKMDLRRFRDAGISEVDLTGFRDDGV